MTRGEHEAARAATVDAIVAERAGVLGFARRFVAQLPALIAAGRLGAADAEALRDRILAFADAVATGLHRDDDELPAVRAAMRALLREGRE